MSFKVWCKNCENEHHASEGIAAFFFMVALSSVRDRDYGESELPARSVTQNFSKVLCVDDDAEHNYLRSSGAL
jgi:hypothetical protein